MRSLRSCPLFECDVFNEYLNHEGFQYCLQQCHVDVVCILQDDVNMLHFRVDWLGCESLAEHSCAANESYKRPYGQGLGPNKLTDMIIMINSLNFSELSQTQNFEKCI